MNSENLKQRLYHSNKISPKQIKSIQSVQQEDFFQIPIESEQTLGDANIKTFDFSLNQRDNTTKQDIAEF